MAQSAHFINRQEGIGRKGLELQSSNVYRSCCWTISETEALSLVGGWIYLHDSKGENSAMGGVVQSVEQAHRLGKAKEAGFAIIFKARHEGRGQKWCGVQHSMAWWSGLVELPAVHEKDG